MSKEMIISVNGREKKIAILDNGRVSEFYIERGNEENSGIVGNIYKGKVMRVLPGMQSAFVAIGLERDAFLYVSDFFDEEEEIERIVMEKSKKSSPEEAKREAEDQIQRARLEREKQMEAVQDIAEPMTAADAEDDPEFEPVAEMREEFPAEKRDDKRERPRRDNKGRDNKTKERPFAKNAPRDFGETFNKQPTENVVKDSEEADAEIFEAATIFEMDDSGFERIIDDEDTGEMFKDAYMQEAIVDKVRAIEFDMESAATAEVGSLLDAATSAPNGFERIADDDDEPQLVEPKKPKGRGNRGGRNKSKAAQPANAAEENAAPAETRETADQTAAAEVESPKKDSVKSKKETNAGSDEATKSQSSKKKNRGGKKTGGKETLEDAQASVKESNSPAEMAVRRGGRGRRRPGEPERQERTAKPETDEKPELKIENIESDAPAESSRPINLRSDNRDNNRNEGNRNEGSRNDNSRRERSNNSGGSGGRRDQRNQPTITDLLREGQEILVQIAKEPIAKKGARITSHIALPGRFLVYMPTIEHLGVSRKIESASERSRLRVAIQKIRAEEDVPSGGFIVRTAGVGVPELDLRQDARYLVRTWLDMKKVAEKSKSPALVHQDLDIIQRLLRDQLSDDFTAIRVDSEEEYLRINEFINRIQPRMMKRVKLYTRDEPILEAYGVQEEVDKALKPRVWLKSGGYLVINQTEALVAIDVNTGKFVGKGSNRLEDTITKTNMEAVDEIARQIRLRDLGGIIVLDLIDMEDRRNRNKVSQALQEALAGDKSPTKVLSFNDFGLIIMTRKRVKQSLERTMCEPCDYCEGAGWVKSAQTVCYEILEESRRLSKSVDDVRQTTLRVHPDVARALNESENQVLEEIEEYLGNVDITGDKSVHQEQFDFAFI
ncbi:MAG: Rne/Rng family ribonuclease [Pyrinomonadaceae bacterium]|nr:Rne/Rng family ribonuclease [Pyrinomonadaceae bacterium]